MGDYLLKLDLIMLPIGVAIITVILIVQSFVLLGIDVEAEVDAQSDFQTEVFESRMSASHLVLYNDTYRNLNNLSAENRIDEVDNLYVGNDISNASARIGGDFNLGVQIEGEESEVNINEEGFEDSRVSTAFNIATPKTSDVNMTVRTD